MMNQSNLEEVYRGINKYMDFTTGEELIVACDPSHKAGVARMRATRERHPNGKNRATKTIGNQYVLIPQTGHNGHTYNVKKYTTHFEFVETWCEKASEWERV